MMRIQAVFAVVLASVLGLSAFACSAGDDVEGDAVVSVDEAVVGARCSPTSGGPLPVCGSSSEYCQVASCANTGTCAARPTGCFTIFDPVCGCNGVTYSNPCEAARAGVSVRRKGRC